MIDVALAVVGLANLAAVAWLLTRQTEEDTMHVTATFTHACADCGGTVRVVEGQPRRHWCRWRVVKRRNHRRVRDAWVEGYEFARAEFVGSDA